MSQPANVALPTSIFNPDGIGTGTGTKLPAGGGAAAAAVPASLTTWNAGASWGVAVNGVYSLVLNVAQATHLNGATPNVRLQEGTGPYTDVIPHSLSISATGDVIATLQATAGPDYRFAGRMVISS